MLEKKLFPELWVPFNWKHYIPKMIEESADRRVQSAKNRSPERGLVLENTTPFLEIDFWQLSIPPTDQILNRVRYNPVQKSILESRRYIVNCKGAGSLARI